MGVAAGLDGLLGRHAVATGLGFLAQQLVELTPSHAGCRVSAGTAGSSQWVTAGQEIGAARHGCVACDGVVGYTWVRRRPRGRHGASGSPQVVVSRDVEGREALARRAAVAGRECAAGLAVVAG